MNLNHCVMALLALFQNIGDLEKMKENKSKYSREGLVFYKSMQVFISGGKMTNER